MIKRLQRKFVLIAISAVTLVIVILIGLINGINLYQINQSADDLLRILSENNGNFPEFRKGYHKPGDMTEETRFETRYFVVWADNNNSIFRIDTGHIAAVSSSDAEKYASEILSGSQTSGLKGSYKYRMTEKEDQSKLLIFVDCSSRLRSAVSLFLLSCSIAIICIIVVFILVSVYSGRAIRPVLESMEKQKQFITDAGHEIKTPLAIISANADVLELTGGNNEWLTSIRNQTKRLDGLVKNLLTLSKLEEGEKCSVYTDFNLSDAVAETAQPFQTLAENQEKTLNLDIQPEIKMDGEEISIKQLVSILSDNAVKYADDGGRIQIALERKGKVARLNVYNDYDSAADADLNKLFDRFYRADTSRSRETGGYGIGLSIAKAIVETHRGKITAKQQEKGISFQVLLPVKTNTG